MNKYKNVKEFLGDLAADKLAQVTELRKLILASVPALTENLKWNAPNYVYKNEDRITFNLLNKEGKVKLILHMGAERVEDRKAKPVMNDESGLIEWISNIRGIITFADNADVIAKRNTLKAIIKNWLAAG